MLITWARGCCRSVTYDNIASFKSSIASANQYSFPLSLLPTSYNSSKALFSFFFPPLEVFAAPTNAS